MNCQRYQLECDKFLCAKEGQERVPPRKLLSCSALKHLFEAGVRPFYYPATCSRVIRPARSDFETLSQSSALPRAYRSITRAMIPVHPV